MAEPPYELIGRIAVEFEQLDQAVRMLAVELMETPPRIGYAVVQPLGFAQCVDLAQRLTRLERIRGRLSSGNVAEPWGVAASFDGGLWKRLRELAAERARFVHTFWMSGEDEAARARPPRGNFWEVDSYAPVDEDDMELLVEDLNLWMRFVFALTTRLVSDRRANPLPDSSWSGPLTEPQAG